VIRLLSFIFAFYPLTFAFLLSGFSFIIPLHAEGYLSGFDARA
jgi:hypothetical protein